MFSFSKLSETRLNSVRSKFVKASISRLIHDWSRSGASEALQRRIDFAIDRRLRPLASEALQRHLSIDFQTQDIIGKIFACSERLMFCFWESNEKRLNSVRSKFADASISRLIEDRGCNPKYERHVLHSRHWLGESMKRSAEVENVFYIFIFTW